MDPARSRIISALIMQAPCHTSIRGTFKNCFHRHFENFLVQNLNRTYWTLTKLPSISLSIIVRNIIHEKTRFLSIYDSWYVGGAC